jgi:DNA-binding CsgD family transcriptional regulator
LAREIPDGDDAVGGRQCLSADARRLYQAIARQEWDLVDRIVATKPGARSELSAWDLIDDTADRPVPRNPRTALKWKVERELAEARRRVELMADIPDLAEVLERDYQAGQLRVAGAGSEYLADPALVNARLQDAVADARTEILAAQPFGPRSPELLDIALSRDAVALDRGVRLRTIYRDTVRDHPVTAEYARVMATRGSGCVAQYRTMIDPFERMIIVDGETAFVSDHVVEGSPEHAAWMVTDPAAVAVLAKVFDLQWMRADPWTGELRTGTGRLEVDTVTAADGVRTSRQQRGIMRYLCSGTSQTATARRMGISKRKLEEHIADIKALWGVRTLNELIFQYALSPDRLVDDGAPADTAAGEDDTDLSGASQGGAAAA